MTQQRACKQLIAMLLKLPALIKSGLCRKSTANRRKAEKYVMFLM